MYNFLLNTATSNSSYFIIGIQLIFVVVMIVAMVAISALLGPKRKTKEKLETFTSGIETHGDARKPVAVKYFLVAILFVLFDVEVIFFYPYAVNFKALGWDGFFAVLMFVSFFIIGFTYIIKKGALTLED
ncbi:MAG: NADH-quinone oxidoreductase subunit A [Chitinophagaceae bacterium]|nr:NADH-quinone oxidoreductase subunit A [Chitinophagaceae bacterium]MCW5904378.1 NADH-quinone oxidoreductase subunit A [Chitinophagaceae bacterium]